MQHARMNTRTPVLRWLVADIIFTGHLRHQGDTFFKLSLKSLRAIIHPHQVKQEMHGPLESEVNRLIQTGVSLLNNYQSEMRSLETPAARTASDFITEGVRFLVTDLTMSKRAGNYGRKASRAVLQIMKKQRQAAVTQRYYMLYLGWLGDVTDLLSQVSTSSSRIVAPGNSQNLIRKVKLLGIP